MRRLGPAFFIGSVLLLGACKKSQDPAPVAPSPAPTEAKAVVPVPAFTLSYLQDAPNAGCTWTRQDTGGAKKVLFTADAACERLALAWSPDGNQGAVIDRGTNTVKPRAWLVNVQAGQGVPLALPELGHTDAVGFDAAGRPVALVSQVEDLVRRADGASEYFLFEGQHIPITQPEGGPGLAHAFRREGDAWKRIETVATVYESGTSALTTTGMLVSSTSSVDPDAAATNAFPEGSEDAARLDAVVKEKGHDKFGEWVSIETDGGPLYAWRATSELSELMPPLRWEVQDKLVEPEALALAPTSAVDLRVRGPLLLVSSDKAVRVYDAKSKRRVFALDGVHATRFWPKAHTVTAAVPSDAATPQ
ncbi:hypothetical protein JY651_43110 [Pyxidicoccus parkwayensis]|uniref:Lipoprotein n=1 Tax=Pyxidicoccus parkwayensis TaxID=2813578 RepID=A0ABX7NSK3_9BACT|nr:hypothetical protein [Pyxidicoccus parkwaysis]QSQ21870.1 hypothetical protein JY651_43110 [Pyxidicoccus parkwaysis]